MISSISKTKSHICVYTTSIEQNNISVQNTSSGGTNFDYIYYIDINNVLINIKSCQVFSNNRISMVVISCRRKVFPLYLSKGCQISKFGYINNDLW